MSLRDWHGDEFDSDAHLDYCAFCGQLMESPGRRRGGIGARICYDCASPEPKHEYKSDGNRREPSCVHCGRESTDAVHSVSGEGAVPGVPAGVRGVAGRGNEEA